MASTTTTTNTKNNNDPWTGTEYQHDFGPRHGLPFGKIVIDNPSSKAYRDYVDKYHLWNAQTDGRGNWAFTDDGIVSHKIRDGNDEPIDKRTLKSLRHGDEIKAGISNHKYIVYKAPGGRRSQFKGAELAKQLNIPNNSVTIIDTDGIIGRSMKVNSKRKSIRSQDDIDYTMFVFINCVISADSAGKVSIDNQAFFSGIKGINCKALINRQDITIKANNNDMKMNYWIENTWMSVGKTKQKWNEKDVDDDTDVREFTTTEFQNAHHENKRSSVFKVAQKMIRNNGASLKDPTPTGQLGPTRQHDSRVRQPLQKIDDGILALMRKRSGDLFQGWMTKHLHNFTGTVRERFFTKPGKSWEMDERGPIPFQQWKNETRGIGDIFTTTIDYPYLVWCLENGVNVLFRVGPLIMYFRKQ